MIRQRHKKNDVGTASNTAINLDRVDTATRIHDQDAIVIPSSGPPLVDPTHSCYYHYIFHLLSIIITLIGISLTYQKLYTHEECDMTWSQRQFIQVDIFHHTQPSNNHQHHQYKFYKFIDQRDPRYKHLHMKSHIFANDSSTSWCSSSSSSSSSSSNIVLYVPGHGGSYQQSRSIGAHGVQLTQRHIDSRTQQAILQRLSIHGQQRRDTDRNTTTSTTLDEFFFDVYAFDFNEEGGAFHASIIERQAEYMVHVIMTLAEVCRRVDSKKNEAFPIHIVAHSIGGISTRLALQQLQLINSSSNSTSKNVRIQSVITLGTPHYMPVWSWDTSMHNLYHKLFTNKPSPNIMIGSVNDTLTATASSTTIISISGGLRDEMIPPKACYLDDNNEISTNVQFSAFTSDIMIPARIEGKEYVPPYLGVDHRAIVWCHNVLSQVRYILYSVIHLSNDIDNDSPIERSNTSNNRSIQKQQNLVRQKLFELSSTSKRNKSHDFLDSLSDVQQSMKKKYGWYTAFAMETSLLYNTEILVNLFAVIGTMRYLRLDYGIGNKLVSPTILNTFSPILCTILYYWISISVKRKHTIPILSIFILAFLADAIFISTKFVLQKYFQGTLSYTKHIKGFFVIKTISILTILLWTILYAILGRESWFRMEFVIAFTATALVSFLSILLITMTPKRESVLQTQALYRDRQLNYVVMLLWLLPPIAIGEVYAIFKGIDAWGVYAIVIPVVVRLLLDNNSVNSSLHRPVIPRTKQILAVQLCQCIMLPLCCWSLLTLDIHYQIILHPLPMLLFVATTCIIPES